MSILSAIGNTPLVELTNLNDNLKVRIFGKLEGANPGSSVKDRPAYYMIKKAEELEELTRDKIILEPTSGNTGISLAMIGAAKGYHVALVMPECVSMERRRILEAFGAEVILTPGCDGTDGAIRRSHELIMEDPEKPGFLQDMDLIYPDGYGEALSGGEREHRYDRIKKRILQKGGTSLSSRSICNWQRMIFHRLRGLALVSNGLPGSSVG